MYIITVKEGTYSLTKDTVLGYAENLQDAHKMTTRHFVGYWIREYLLWSGIPITNMDVAEKVLGGLIPPNTPGFKEFAERLYYIIQSGLEDSEFDAEIMKLCNDYASLIGEHFISCSGLESVYYDIMKVVPADSSMLNGPVQHYWDEKQSLMQMHGGNTKSAMLYETSEPTTLSHEHHGCSLGT